MPHSRRRHRADELASLHVRARASSPAVWQELLSRVLVPCSVRVPHGRELRAELAGRRCDEVLFATLVASAHCLERDAALATQDEESCVLVLLARGSARVRQGGREAELSAGDLVLCDSARPSSIELEDELAAVVIHLPQRMLDVPAETLARVTAVRIDGSQGLGGTVAQFLRGVTSTLARLDASTALRVTHHATDLVTTLVEHELGLVERGDSFAELCRRIDTYITANLADPTLSPERIAAACYISTRYLHAIFHRRGTTVSRWVRERRLEHARRELLCPTTTRRSVAQVAAAWGFVDPSHFSKVFRERFGTSPTRYRVEVQGATAV